jgi:hypothetical protein
MGFQAVDDLLKTCGKAHESTGSDSPHAIPVNLLSIGEAKRGDPGGDRTRDPLIKSQMLYH